MGLHKAGVPTSEGAAGAALGSPPRPPSPAGSPGGWGAGELCSLPKAGSSAGLLPAVPRGGPRPSFNNSRQLVL